VKLSRSRKGFTLVEVIVALLIFAIVVAVAAGFLIFGGNFLNRSEQHAEDKRLAENTADYVKNRLLYATNVQVIRSDTPPSPSSDGEVIFIGSDTNGDGSPDELAHTGHLYYMRADGSAPVDVFGIGDYRGSLLALAYDATVDIAPTEGAINALPPKTFGVKAMAVRNNEQSYHSEKTFRLYNVGEKSEPISDMSISTWSGGANGEKFYLLINSASVGNYVEDGLIARYDAIDNRRSDALHDKPWHDASAVTKWEDLSGNSRDMDMIFTSNPNPIRDKSLYFDGNGDYGNTFKITQAAGTSVGIGNRDTVTVEICFREADKGLKSILYEYSTDATTQPMGFCLALNDASGGKCHITTGKTTTGSSGQITNQYYDWADQNTSFATAANAYTLKANEPPHTAWMNGVIKSVTGDTAVYTSSRVFTGYNFFLASRNGKSNFFKGEISAVRIYGRQLTSDEVARNAAVDALRFR
jgi:prepilin-type N-terminal cleavage/methylation domain-containing protein